jgi:hypothetical protein
VLLDALDGVVIPSAERDLRFPRSRKQADQSSDSGTAPVPGTASRDRRSRVPLVVVVLLAVLTTTTGNVIE